uniref:Uncharacterized protein n=1 Tax=Arundo donax TaxID=35708 RepID=A0A0A9DGY9_ARUDO
MIKKNHTDTNYQIVRCYSYLGIMYSNQTRIRNHNIRSKLIIKKKDRPSAGSSHTRWGLGKGL